MIADNQLRIIAGLHKKDKFVIEELYDLYGDTLYGIILKIIPQETIAQDILQDAFIKIWENGPKYQAEKGSLFTWMLNICRNTAIDKTRSANYKRRNNFKNLDPSFNNNKNWSVKPSPDLIGLKQEVLKLEEKYKEVLELIYFQGFTQKEVCEELELPLGTVKSRVRIGIRELRKVFVNDHIQMILLLIFFEQVFNFFIIL